MIFYYHGYIRIIDDYQPNMITPAPQVPKHLIDLSITRSCDRYVASWLCRERDSEFLYPSEFHPQGFGTKIFTYQENHCLHLATQKNTIIPYNDWFHGALKAHLSAQNVMRQSSCVDVKPRLTQLAQPVFGVAVQSKPQTRREQPLSPIGLPSRKRARSDTASASSRVTIPPPRAHFQTTSSSSQITTQIVPLTMEQSPTSR